jgi:hypothetical protein
LRFVLLFLFPPSYLGPYIIPNLSYVPFRESQITVGGKRLSTSYLRRMEEWKLSSAVRNLGIIHRWLVSLTIRTVQSLQYHFLGGLRALLQAVKREQ